MLILLPPSEGKAASGSGAPLNLSALTLPDLAPAREVVLDALIGVSDDEAKARAVLGLSPGQVAEVHRNARLRTARTLPAARAYTGVLYDALDLAGLDQTARRAANRSILIFSGLWGVVRPTDRIPPYRCSIGVSLPGIGPLAAHWKRALAEPLTEYAGSGLVLDLRSGAYTGMWRPPARHVTVRVLHEREVDGARTRTVVSHFNKATKGRIVRDLLTCGARPKTQANLVAALRDLGYIVEAPSPHSLDVVVTQL